MCGLARLLAVQVPDELAVERRKYASLVDHRKMVHVKISPPRGVATVVGNYPLPVWQKVWYFLLKRRSSVSSFAVEKRFGPCGFHCFSLFWL